MQPQSEGLFPSWWIFRANLMVFKKLTLEGELANEKA